MTSALSAYIGFSLCFFLIYNFQEAVMVGFVPTTSSLSGGDPQGVALLLPRILFFLLVCQVQVPQTAQMLECCSAEEEGGKGGKE